MKPIYDLIKWKKNPSESSVRKAEKSVYDKKAPVVWNDELQAILDDVIDTLKSPAVMAYPDFEKPFVLNCDASGYGLGAVLYQQQGDDLRVISYASRTLSEAEQNYHLHSGKLEFLALKWSVTDKFSNYLGHGATFTVYTDNNPLTYVMTSAKLNATGMRWVNELSDYNFTLKYRPGKLAADADGLSRNPLSPTDIVPAVSPTCSPSVSSSSTASSPPPPAAATAAQKSSQITELQRECTMTMTREDLAQVLSPPDISHCQLIDINSLNLTSLQNESTPPLKSISKTELSKAQSDDEVIGPVYKAVSIGERPNRRLLASFGRRSRLLVSQWNSLYLKDGVLLRKTALTTR